MAPVEISSLIQELYAIVARLEVAYPGRPFTLDGHLVGSIGEVLARQIYDLELLPPSTEKHDARTTDGRLVQIKATGSKSVSLYSEPDFLLVLKIDDQGIATEVFNGPARDVWQHCGKLQKNGQRQISLSVLKELNKKVSANDRIPQIGHR